MVIAGLSNAASAELIFNIGSTGNSQADSGFQMAADNISRMFTDSLTVNITTSFRSLGAGILGQTNTVKGNVDYNEWKSFLDSDSTSANDSALASSLPGGSSFSVLINGTSNNPNGSGSSTAYLDSTGANTSTVSLSSANAKSIGLIAGDATGNDADISFSSDFNFDFDPTDGIDSGSIDFVGVAMHEMFHSLGFFSGIDILDYYTQAGPGASLYEDDIFTYVTPLDFLRHSADSIAAGADLDFTADTRSKLLSIDGGSSILLANAWSTGKYNGDGQQGSHWIDDHDVGGMDPTASQAGTKMYFSDNDYLAMDVIGWNLSSNITAPSVPLPATAALLGLGLLGFGARRKKNA